MSKSLSVTFRIPADMIDSFNAAVNESGTDKTTWLIDAISRKLGQPGSNPDHRMLALVERMEAAVIQIVAGTIREGFDNGRYC